MAEFQMWNLVIVGEHWAIEKRRLREFGEIWSRMNKGTAVQGMTGSIGEDHADNDEECSTTPDSKQRNHKSKILIRPKSRGMLKEALQQIGPVDLPEFILNMRSSGLKIKLNTVEGLLEEKKRAENLFGAMHSTAEALEHNELVVYKNKSPADLPLNPELDITTDPKRALRRMLMMLKANSNPGRTGTSSLLVVRKQTNNSGQSAAAVVAAAFNALHIGGHRSESNNEQDQQQHHKKQAQRHNSEKNSDQQLQRSSKQGHAHRRRSSVHPTHGNQPSSNTTAVESSEIHSGDAHVLMCELSVLLSWIWESFWPGGSPLNMTEQAEVQERFQDWSKAVQASRKPSVGDKEDMWDPDHDYGTTFSVFAGWFLVLVSYLCKLREIEDVDEDELDDWIDEMLDDESVDEVTKQKVAKRLALRERFLRRRVQGFVMDSGTATTDEVEEILVDEDIASQHMKRRNEVSDFSQKSNISEISLLDDIVGSETSFKIEKKLKLRQRFLKRRVQAYAPIGDNDDDDTSSLEPAVREALKDAYFGQAPPEPFEFTAGGRTEHEDIPNSIKIDVQKKIVNRERFLRRRVQVYSPIEG